MGDMLADAAAAAPTSAGVYYLLATDGELLYVGKAANIRVRLRQHAAAVATDHARLGTLYRHTTGVRWETATDADAAAAREADVVVALRPRFNAAIGGDGRWNYIVVSDDGSSTRFTLTRDARRGAARHVYGCFPHLGKGVASQPAIACSDGYTALLRLLWASSATSVHMPARITRSAPDDFDVTIDASLGAALHRFLSGTSDRLLTELEDRAETDLKMLAPALARDRALALGFYATGPRALRQLRRRHGHRGLVSREQFASLVAADTRASIGDFRLPPPVTTADEVLGRSAHRWSR
jgi:hypothetical protein